MAFEAQTFSFEEVLTSAKMQQIDTNIDLVRIDHKGSSAPAVIVAGVRHLDDTTEPWVLKRRGNAAWLRENTFDPTRLFAMPGVSMPPLTQAASYTAVASVANLIHLCDQGIGVQLDPAASLGIGWAAGFANVGSNDIVTLYPTSGELINNEATQTLRRQNAIILLSDGANLFTLGGAGAWHTLEVQNPSGDTSLDLTAFDNAAYDMYQIIGYMLPSANGNYLDMRVSLNAGASFETTSHNYIMEETDRTNGTTNQIKASNQSEIRMLQAGSTTVPAAINIMIYSPGTADDFKCDWRGSGFDSNDGEEMTIGAGQRSHSSAVDAVQFDLSGGANITGRFILLGRKAA